MNKKVTKKLIKAAWHTEGIYEQCVGCKRFAFVNAETLCKQCRKERAGKK